MMCMGFSSSGSNSGSGSHSGSGHPPNWCALVDFSTLSDAMQASDPCCGSLGEPEPEPEPEPALTLTSEPAAEGRRPPVAAQLAIQTTTSGAEDTAMLMEIEGAADTSACHDGIYPYDEGPCPLDSWTAATEPCGDGWDSTSGWVGVVCDASGGRVAYVDLHWTGVGGELLPFFGRLGALLYLVLLDNPALRGDVAELAGATELRYLTLSGCPLVVGDAAALAALIHLGEEYTVPGYSTTRTGALWLAGSGVHGPVAALRALPGLGADWGSDSYEYGRDFTPCSAFGGQQASSGNDYTWGTGSPGCGAAGLAPVAGSTDVAGIDECACCGPNAPRGHDDSGACVGDPSIVRRRGCTYELATNYDPAATEDEGAASSPKTVMVEGEGTGGTPRGCRRMHGHRRLHQPQV